MNTVSFVYFFATILTILLFIDIYFLVSWQKFVKARKWHKLTYIFPWILGLVFFIFYATTLYFRLENKIPTDFEKTFFSIAAIWYLPKILIVPIILIKDLIVVIKRYFDKFSNKQGLTNENNISTKRREFIKNTGWALAGVPFILVTRGVFHTTYDFRIHRVNIQLDKLGAEFDGFKIIQLSDIHAGSFLSDEPFGKAREIIEGLEPDIIVITGDFVNFHPRELKIIYPELSQLKAKYGVFGCLGNHDHYMTDDEHQNLISFLNKSGINLLINENTKISIGSSILQLIGVDNVNFRSNYADFPKAMTGIQQEYPSILLCHDPTNWDRFVRNKLNIDLMLSGHTHGGQVGIELFGQYLSPVRIVYKQWAGLYQDGEQYLYINRGLGVVGPPVRVDMPPEITFIELSSKKFS